MVVSTILIGVLGFSTWVHHMFVSGVDPMVERFFMFTTMVIAVPTGIKIFSWIATMWGGSLNLKTPLLMCLGFLSTFVIGGITGVIQGGNPGGYAGAQTLTGWWRTSTMCSLAAASLASSPDFFYWLPKINGRMLNDKLGKVQFWFMWVGFNLTFFPMHIPGAGRDAAPYRHLCC